MLSHGRITCSKGALMGLLALAWGFLSAAAALGEPLQARPKPAETGGVEQAVERLVEQGNALSGGKFLVAARSMQDPNFAESVVLLVDHEAEGSWGLVVNRPTTIKLSELFAKDDFLRRRRDNLHYGGPVEPARILILVRSSAALADSRALFADVRLAWSPEALKGLGDPVQAELRVFAGYAGWAVGQLEAEIARKDWLILPAEAALVFSETPEAVWEILQARSPQPVAAAAVVSILNVFRRLAHEKIGSDHDPGDDRRSSLRRALRPAAESVPAR
jgi:putative transcriptional regulator